MIACLAFIGVFAATYTYTDLMRPGTVERTADRSVSERAPGSAPQTLASTRIQPPQQLAVRSEAMSAGEFTICHTGGGVNCVVDGDTAWIAGVKVRVADIDAPETHPPRCPEEARLGALATGRLAEIMNMGPFELVVHGPAQDRYGRQLRILVRDGRSLGVQLVKEGLARRWEGARRPWC